MQSPEEVATAVVNAFTGDHYWIDKLSSIAAVATALRAYGAATAAQECARCAAVAENTAGGHYMACIVAVAIRALD